MLRRRWLSSSLRSLASGVQQPQPPPSPATLTSSSGLTPSPVTAHAALCVHTLWSSCSPRTALLIGRRGIHTADDSTRRRDPSQRQGHHHHHRHHRHRHRSSCDGSNDCSANSHNDSQRRRGKHEQQERGQLPRPSQQTQPKDSKRGEATRDERRRIGKKNWRLVRETDQHLNAPSPHLTDACVEPSTSEGRCEHPQSKPSASTSTAMPAADDRRLRRLLHTHASMRRNYQALQPSDRVYASMCRMCLRALQSSCLLQRLARVLTAEPERADGGFARLRVHTGAAGRGEDSSSRPPEGSRDEADDGGGGGGNDTLEVRLPISFIRWLNRSLSLPELPADVLFASSGSNAEEGGRAAAAGVRALEVWQRHCREQWGVTELVAATLEEALGAAKRESAADLVEGGDNGDPCSAPSPLPPLVDVRAAGLAVALLNSIAFFKWVKDDGDMETRLEQKLGTGGEDGKDGTSVGDRLGSIRSCLRELQSLSERASSSSVLKEPTDVDAMGMIKQRWKLTQEVLKQSVAILNIIPKVDRVGCLEAGTVPREAQARTQSEGDAVSEPTYTAHVLDLYLSVFLRYVLAAWPHLPSSAQRGSLFWMTMQPWFSSDIAGSAASWFTCWEFHRPSVFLFPSTAEALLARKDIAAAAQMCATASSDHITFVQQMHLLCWPTVLDRRSSIAERALQMGVHHHHHTAAPPDMKELAAVLYSSEKKQRLAYELMYVYCFSVRRNLEAVAGRLGRDNDALLRALLIPSQPHNVSAFGVLGTDADRFVSERFFAAVHQRQRWLLLPAADESGTAEEGHATGFRDQLRTAVSRQCSEPYMLTREILPSLCLMLEPHWSSLPPKRADLLYEAFVRALVDPCQHALAFLLPGSEDGVDGVVSRCMATWKHQLEPLLPFIASKPFQGFFWKHFLRGTTEVPPPPQTQPFEERLTQLVKLGYLASYVLTAREVAREALGSASAQAERDVEELHGAVRSHYRHSVLSLLREEGGHPPTAQAVAAAAVSQWVSQWPRSSSSDGVERREAPREGSAECGPAMLMTCYRLLSSAVFTPQLYKELEAWLARRATPQKRPLAGGGSVRDPVLLRWRSLLQDEERGQQTLPLTLTTLYEGLWKVTDARYREVSNGGDSDAWAQSLRRRPAESPRDAAPATAAASTLSDRLRLSVDELAVVLRVMSGVFARGGIATLSLIERNSPGSRYHHKGSPPRASADGQEPLLCILESMAKATLQSTDGAVPQKTNSREGDGTRGERASSTAAPQSPEDVCEQRLHAIQVVLRASVSSQLPAMTTTAHIDAVYLGIASWEDVVAATDSAVLDDDAWVASVAEEFSASRAHALFTCELLMMRYAAYIPVQSPTQATDRQGRSATYLLRLLEAAVKAEMQRLTSDKATGTREKERDGSAGFVTMVDHARGIASAHAVAAYLFLTSSSSSGSDAASAAAAPPVDLCMLFALLLALVDACVPAVASRGRGEELMLWLSTGALLVQTRYQDLMTPPGEGLTPAWFVGAPPPPGKARKDAAASAPSRFVQDGVTRLLRRSRRRGTHRDAADFDLLRKWFHHVFTRLSPLVLNSLFASRGSNQSSSSGSNQSGGSGSGSGSSGGGWSPSLRQTAYIALAVRALQEIGVEAPDSLLALVDQLLQSSLQDRRLVQRLHRLVAAAVASQSPTFSSQMTSHGVAPLASYLRDAREVLSRDELREALLLIRAVAGPTMNPLATAVSSGAAHQYNSQLLLSPLSSIDWTETKPGRPRRGREEWDGGEMANLRTTTTQPQFPVSVVPAASLRAAWGALVRRLLLVDGAGDPAEPTPSSAESALHLVSLLVIALSSGAAVGCADTKLFERLLAFTVMQVEELSLAMDGQSSGPSSPPTPSLAEWSWIVKACGTAQGGERRGMAALLKDPLQRLVAALAADPSLWLPGGDSGGGEHDGEDSRHRLRRTRLLTEKMRESAQGLCLLLEALPDLYTETDGFWKAVRGATRAFAEALGDPSRRQVLGDSEVEFWREEWTQSYNCAVLTAGHPALQVRAGGNSERGEN